MKNLLFIILLSLVTFSCSQSFEEESSQPPPSSTTSSNIKLLSTNAMQSWENMETVRLASGIDVPLPWSSKGGGNLPEDVRFGITRANGWSLVESSLNTYLNLNYIIFYNKYTGILRGFFYNEKTILQNTGLWHLTFSQPQKLFNNSRYFTLPINGTTQSSSLTVSNIINSHALAFESGWNCFQTELAYDPSYDSNKLKLTVTASNINKSEIKMNGSYNSVSKGTIITTTSSSNGKKLDGIAKAAGEGTKSYLEENLGKFIKVGASVGSLISGGAGALVTEGVNKIFGSFLGSSSTTTSSDLNFTTNGTVEINGELTTPLGGLIHGNSDILFNATDKYGVWNLSENPIIEFGRYIYLPSSPQVSPLLSTQLHPQLFSGPFPFPSHRLYNVKVIMNPAVSSAIIKYSVSSEVVRYSHTNLLKGIEYNVPAKSSQFITPLSTNNPNKILYQDNLTTIQEMKHPQYFFTSLGGRSGERIDLAKQNMIPRCDLVVKVTVTYETKNNGTIYSTRSFIPDYRWENEFADPNPVPPRGDGGFEDPNPGLPADPWK